MISISFVKTKKDYYQTELIYSLKNWPILLLAGIAISPFSCCLSSLFISKTDIPPLSGSGLLGLILGSFALPVFLLLVIIARVVLRGNIYIKNPEISMDFSPEKVHVKNNLVDIQYEWENFSSIIESRDLFLLAFSANTLVTHIIPKRAFQTEEQLQNFRNLLAEKEIGQLKTFNKTNRRIFILLIISVISIFFVCCMVLFSGIIQNMLGISY